MTVASFDEITADKPEKSLTERLMKKGGRNQQGRLTVRHQGGGHKRLYRVIDFKRTKDGIPARVATSWWFFSVHLWVRWWDFCGTTRSRHKFLWAIRAV